MLNNLDENMLENIISLIYNNKNILCISKRLYELIRKYKTII